MIARVPLQDIDFSDESYRISEELDLDTMRASLLEVGQVNPVTLLEEADGRKVVVTGFRRLLSLRRIGADVAAAEIRDRRHCTHLQAFRLALWDNLAHRRLQALEAARALRVLRDTCGLSAESILGDYLPVLGLSRSRKVLETYLKLNDIDAGLRVQLSRGLITVSSAERLAQASAAFQARAARILANVRLSASRQRQLLDLIGELAVMQGVGAERVIDDAEICALLGKPGLSAHERGQAVYDLMYRRRHPRLIQARSKFESVKARLGLPPNVRLSADPFFESHCLRLEIDIASGTEFRETAEALHRLSQSGRTDALFEELP